MEEMTARERLRARLDAIVAANSIPLAVVVWLNEWLRLESDEDLEEWCIAGFVDTKNIDQCVWLIRQRCGWADYVHVGNVLIEYERVHYSNGRRRHALALVEHGGRLIKAKLL